MSVTNTLPCWLCGGTAHDLVRPSRLPERLSSRDFAITNSDYGRTGALHRCRSCDFLACLEMSDVLPHYEALEDEEYESSRDERGLQADLLLRTVERHVPRSQPG